MQSDESSLRAIAHSALCSNEAPYLKHYNRGRFHLWRDIAFTGSDLPGPGFNFAAVLSPSPILAEIVSFAREFFCEATQGWGILVEGGAGHPIESELVNDGWIIAEDEPAFVLENLEQYRALPHFPDGFTVRSVQSDADEAIFHAILANAFAAPPEFMSMMIPISQLWRDARMGLYIASVDGVDVSGVSFARVCSTAILSGLGTLEAYRRRGYGSLISSFMLVDAAARGCQSAALRSGPISIPLYEKLGFRYVCQHRTYISPPSGPLV